MFHTRIIKRVGPKGGMAFLDGIFVIGKYESPRWNLFYDHVGKRTMYTCADATVGRIVAIRTAYLKNQSTEMR